MHGATIKVIFQYFWEKLRKTRRTMPN